MNEDGIQAHLKAIEIAKARIMEEAAAKAAALDREFAEFQRLAAKFNVPLPPPAAQPAEVSAASANLTIAELIAAYKADPASPYHRLLFKTRENYDSLLRRFERDHGSVKIADLDDDGVQELRVKWSAGGHFAMTDALTGMLRILAAYGTTALKSKECRSLKAITAEMNTRASKPRTERLTVDQVKRIIAKAHEMGRASIALAQAIQFECGLKQAVVIGTWLPIGEKAPPSEITYGNEKWVPGLRWSSLDWQRLILKHPKGEIDLNSAPLVKHELMYRSTQDDIAAGSSAPLIIFEHTGLPYQSYQFRRNWRLIADEAGIPKNVKNMDSRPERTAHLAQKETGSAFG
jgi:hypothetical protein